VLVLGDEFEKACGFISRHSADCTADLPNRTSMGDDCPTADNRVRADLEKTRMFKNNEVALAAVRDAVDALREAIEALKKERDEDIVNERVVAQMKEIKEGIQRQRTLDDLSAKYLSWLIRERAAFRHQADWPTPKTDAEKATKRTLDHYRVNEPEYTWESLAGSTLDSDGGLERMARSIARKVMHARAESVCDEAIARLTPFDTVNP
jgi:hypothetical protein